jgi:membrane-bound metal-dependent hydrolase YbcI (DUF457 family)
MFVGHLGVAFGAKAVAPRIPLGWLVAASYGLDLLWTVFLIIGAERVRVDPGNTLFTPLAFDHYPWSHSLAMAIVWGALATLVASFFLKSRATTVVGFVVVSHWLLDFITHRPDLPLWPAGPLVGIGLWNSIVGTLLVEGLLFAIAIAAYCRAVPARDRLGRWALVALITFTGVIWVSGPFSPPPPNASMVGTVAFAMWLFPLWATWIERHRHPAV